MSWRMQGISNAFEKASTAAASRKIGQLIHIDEDGQATTVKADAKISYPLLQAFDHVNDGVAEACITGIAKTFVETSVGIVVGSKLAVGTTGVGVKLAEAGEDYIGVALEDAQGDGSFVPMVQVQQQKLTIY